MSTVLARDGTRVVRPVRHWKSNTVLLHNQDLLAGLHYHRLLVDHLRLLHRLGVWLGHRGLARHLLACHWLAWGLYDRLGVGLLGCLSRLLLDKRLFLGRYSHRVSIVGHFMFSNYYYF